LSAFINLTADLAAGFSNLTALVAVASAVGSTKVKALVLACHDTSHVWNT
jgi:hypothetical protein